MKQKNSLAIMFTSVLMLVASFGVMWLALTFFGRLSEAPIEDEQRFSFNNNFFGVNISQEDYANYPSLSTSEIPNYMKNYILKPEDAYVLAAKQIENICGIDLKGMSATLAFNTFEKFWEGNIADGEQGAEDQFGVSFHKGFYMDAVSGELYAFSDGKNYSEMKYTKEDYDKCTIMALAKAGEQFPDNIESLRLDETAADFIIQGRSLLVPIRVDVDRVAHYVFLKNDNGEFYICSFVTR